MPLVRIIQCAGDEYVVLVDGERRGTVTPGRWSRPGWMGKWESSRFYDHGMLYKHSFLKAARWVVWRAQKTKERQSKSSKRSHRVRKENRFEVREPYDLADLASIATGCHGADPAVPEHILRQLPWEDLTIVPGVYPKRYFDYENPARRRRRNL